MWYDFLTNNERRHNMLTKILIADPSEEFRFVLTRMLGKCYTVLSCGTGPQALELLRTEAPDLMVLDLMLSGFDGLTLLSTARSEGICPPSFVTSAFFFDHIANALQRENVVYLMRKPCDMDVLISRIREVAEELSPQLFFGLEPRGLVMAALFELGIPAKRIGSGNCREAILMLKDDPNALLSKDIYPVLAQAQKVSAGSIEKNIRDTITDAYQHRNDAVWVKYFPLAPNGQIPKPTNRVFLTTLAQVLFHMQRHA